MKTSIKKRSFGTIGGLLAGVLFAATSCVAADAIPDAAIANVGVDGAETGLVSAQATIPEIINLGEYCAWHKPAKSNPSIAQRVAKLECDDWGVYKSAGHYPTLSFNTTSMGFSIDWLPATVTATLSIENLRAGRDSFPESLKYVFDGVNKVSVLPVEGLQDAIQFFPNSRAQKGGAIFAPVFALLKEKLEDETISSTIEKPSFSLWMLETITQEIFDKYQNRPSAPVFDVFEQYVPAFADRALRTKNEKIPSGTQKDEVIAGLNFVLAQEIKNKIEQLGCAESDDLCYYKALNQAMAKIFSNIQ